MSSRVFNNYPPSFSKTSEGASEVAFSIPWPPSTNRVWRVGSGARVYKAEKYEKFLDSMRARAFAGEIPAIKEADRYGVALFLFPPSRAKYDVDNRIKATFDALTRVNFWEDDSRVAFVQTAKMPPYKGGAVGVQVWTLAEDELTTPTEEDLTTFELDPAKLIATKEKKK